MHIAVVIPAYNEGQRISKVLRDLHDHLPVLSSYRLSILVVDDGSKDNTSAEANTFQRKFIQNSKLYVIKHGTNLGKGAAAKTGCDAACSLGAELIILMDGDGQHKVVDIPRLIAPLLNVEGSGLVIGVRKGRKKNMPMMMLMGNFVLTSLSRLMFGIKTKDIQSGYRAFTRVTYPKIRWATAQYAMENEMLILASFAHVPVYEVEIATIYHDNYKGTTIWDGLRVFRTMLRWRLFSVSQINHLEKYQLKDQ